MQNLPSTLKEFFAIEANSMASLLRPRREVTQEVKRVVEEVVKTIQKDLKPKEVIKGGSYGKGTNLGSRREVDLVVILDDYVPNEENCLKFLEMVKDSVEKLANPTEGGYYFGVKKHLKSVRLLYQGVHVDILVGCELPDEALTFLSFKQDQVAYASASASKLQKNFVKESASARCKDLIRYAKFWRKLCAFRKSQKPSSFLLELLALYVDSELGKDYDVMEGFKKLLQVVQDDSLRFYWSKYYNKKHIAPLSKATTGRLIVDPANPRNNVANSLPDWSEFKKQASKSLQMIKVSERNQ